MKNFINKFAIPFLLFTMTVAFMTSPMSAAMAINPLIPVGVLTVGAVAYVKYFPTNHSHTMNGVEVEIWAQYIIDRLWKDNQFLTRAFSDDDKVLAGKIVHIPQPGAKPTVVKNRSVFPATAVRRTDTDILYSLDEYSTDPTHIQDAEKVELSYDKINSVYGDHAGQISEDVAGSAIVKWLDAIPQGNIIRTSGGNTSELLTGLTGTRKVITHTDIRKMQKQFNKWNISAEGRTSLLSPDMLDQLLESLSNTQYRDFSAYMDAKEGVVGRLYGFDILSRSEVAVAKETVPGTVTINAYGAANAAADFDVAMFWHKDAVARALGEVKFFENVDRAEYFGDVYSALLRFGGRRRRNDSYGVGAIIQTA